MQACATSGALTVARDQFKQGSPELALQTLSDADVSRRDQLLLHLDRALVSQAAGRYDDSIREFETAFKLTDQLDYFSTRDQATALVSSDWAIRYSGEFSERLWIHTFQMINYLLLDQPQGAAVEARRAVALFEEHADILGQDIFTRYLMALSFEAAGQRDSAQVEYRKLQDDFGLRKLEPLKKDEGEIYLLVASGFIEPKLPGDLLIDLDARISFPYYPETRQSLPEIDVTVDGKRVNIDRVDTALLPVAKSALQQRGKAIAARQAVRLAAKYNIADNISDQDALAGGIARIFLLAIERADTRSWETLPASLSIIRVTVPRDQQKVSVRIDDIRNFAGAIHHIDVPVKLDTVQRNYYLIRTGINNG